MTEAQQHVPALNLEIASATASPALVPAPVADIDVREWDSIVTIHRGLHAAALYLAQHHIASYEAYANQPTLDQSQLNEILVEVTASGVDLDFALHAAHELAAHFTPHIVNGHPSNLMVVITDGEASADEVKRLMQLLRDLRKV